MNDDALICLYHPLYLSRTIINFCSSSWQNLPMIYCVILLPHHGDSLGHVCMYHSSYLVVLVLVVFVHRRRQKQPFLLFSTESNAQLKRHCNFIPLQYPRLKPRYQELNVFNCKQRCARARHSLDRLFGEW